MDANSGAYPLCCPVCARPLERGGGAFFCGAGHSFDISAEGYVNLLLANQKSSHDPGDYKEMVRARRMFLESGGYGCLRAAICQLCLRFSPSDGFIIDSGCGEGYYTNAVAAALPDVRVFGVDISKHAVRLAAKSSHGRALFAVGSAFSLPVSSACADVLLNCFSPLCLPEISRVLKPGGRFIYVVPSPRHLWGLKSLVYDKPYENESRVDAYEGFDYLETRQVRGSLTLQSPQLISALFTMTPYFWKTSPEDKARLESAERLETEIGFGLHIYTKQ